MKKCDRCLTFFEQDIENRRKYTFYKEVFEIMKYRKVCDECLDLLKEIDKR